MCSIFGPSILNWDSSCNRRTAAEFLVMALSPTSGSKWLMFDTCEGTQTSRRSVSCRRLLRRHTRSLLSSKSRTISYLFVSSLAWVCLKMEHPQFQQIDELWQATSIVYWLRTPSLDAELFPFRLGKYLICVQIDISHYSSNILKYVYNVYIYIDTYIHSLNPRCLRLPPPLVAPCNDFGPKIEERERAASLGGKVWWDGNALEQMI